MLAKRATDCSSFVSQVIYDVDGTKSVLPDYHDACVDLGIAPRPVIFTLAICGSPKTRALLQWLGVQVPRWLRNELAYAADPLPVSYHPCLDAAADLGRFCRHLGIPYGFTVESVAIRRTEIEAPVDLPASVRPHL